MSVLHLPGLKQAHQYCVGVNELDGMLESDAVCARGTEHRELRQN